MSTRIKKNDEVIVISGRDKGTRGKVLRVLPETDQVIVEGVGKVKRHQKPTQTNPQGGIVEKELPIHACKVMPIDPKTDKPTRVRAGKSADGKKTRVAAKSGAVLAN
jgi:large subunit ribosomal protein L24